MYCNNCWRNTDDDFPSHKCNPISTFKSEITEYLDTYLKASKYNGITRKEVLVAINNYLNEKRLEDLAEEDKKQQYN